MKTKKDLVKWTHFKKTPGRLSKQLENKSLHISEETGLTHNHIMSHISQVIPVITTKEENKF